MEKDRRTSTALDEARADDPDDPGVPVFVREDDGAPIVGEHSADLGQFHRLLEDSALGRLTLAIEGRQLLGDRVGPVSGRGGQEFRGLARVAESAAGVQARAEFEADVLGGNALSSES